VFAMAAMKGGLTTGACFWGYADFQVGDDVISKIHYGHFK
jgi:hypothetical protein